MKKLIKPLLLITLVVILAVIVIVPAKSYAGSVFHMPGRQGSGPFGPTCYCPQFISINCGCAVFLQ